MDVSLTRSEAGWLLSSIPGLFSCADLTDDGVHPHDLISDHAEESQLVRLGGDLQATLFAVSQQLLPALHHFVLPTRDGFGLLARVHRPQLGCALLQLTHLTEQQGFRKKQHPTREKRHLLRSVRV